MKIPEWDLFLDDEHRNPKLYFKCEHYIDDGTNFNDPETIVDFFCKKLYFRELAEERLYLAARRGSTIVGISEISHGTAKETACRMREIFIRLLLMGAEDFIIIHNHPGGDCTPSRNDIQCLDRLLFTGTTMGIPIVDSIIVGNKHYYSANTAGKIEEIMNKRHIKGEQE